MHRSPALGGLQCPVGAWAALVACWYQSPLLPEAQPGPQGTLTRVLPCCPSVPGGRGAWPGGWAREAVSWGSWDLGIRERWQLVRACPRKRPTGAGGVRCRWAPHPRPHPRARRAALAPPCFFPISLPPLPLCYLCQPSRFLVGFFLLFFFPSLPTPPSLSLPFPRFSVWFLLSVCVGEGSAPITSYLERESCSQSGPRLLLGQVISELQ